MKLNYVDSIRGIAILMVVLVHTGQKITGLGTLPFILVKYGQMGVQLFFFASAYTLCLSASNRSNEKSSLSKYTIRRYFRIAPLYYIGILLYFLIALIEGYNKTGVLSIPIKYSLSNLASNVLFLNGFYSPGNNNIVPGGWSIGTEMAFYVVFPFLFSLSKKVSIKNIKGFLLWVFSGLIISQVTTFAFILYTGIKMANNNFVYFSLFNQISVFFIGIGYYLIREQGDFLKKSLILNFNWKVDLLLFFILSCISLFFWKLKFDYLFSIIPFISALSFLFLIELFRKIIFLNHRFLIRIGQLSYSMYLIHIVFAYYVTETLSHYFIGLMGSNRSLLILYLVSVIGSILLGLLSEKYIEKPFISFGKKIIQKID